MNSFLESKALASPSGKLSEEGRQLIADVREVIEQAKHLVLTKNEGNVLQDFIWHTEQLNGGSATVPNAPVDKQTAKQHGNEALQGLRTLGTLLISNGQFRKLLSDSLTLFRSMAGDAASNAAQKLQPSDEALSQIDKPADDNTWHENPDLSVGNIKNQIKSKVPIGKGDVKAAVNAAQNNAQGNQDPQAAAQDGANAGLNTLQDRMDDGKVDDLKQKANENKQMAREKRDKYKAQTKEYFQAKVSRLIIFG